MTMEPRIDYSKVSPQAFQAMYGLERYIRQCGLEPTLLELMKVRASVLNGCAYCMDMHTKDARAHGETEQRLYAVSVWREAPFFTERERAALAWTDSVTMVSRDQVPDDAYNEVRRCFSEEEIVNLTMAVVTINSWNRLAIAFRVVAGTYEPAAAT